MGSGVPDLYDPWGPIARAQGLIIAPEGSVSDNGAGQVAGYWGTLAGASIRAVTAGQAVTMYVSQNLSSGNPRWMYPVVKITPSRVFF